MISVIKATEKDHAVIAHIGKISVGETHRASCSPADMNNYLEENYNPAAISKELDDPANIYHIITWNNEPAGFSKIILNAGHPAIAQKNVAKLDRIYLLKEFHGLKLGITLLSFNIQLTKQNGQSGMWLFTWVGNHKAISFYLKAGFTIVGNDWFKLSENHSNEQHHMLLLY